MKIYIVILALIFICGSGKFVEASNYWANKYQTHCDNDCEITKTYSQAQMDEVLDRLARLESIIDRLEDKYNIVLSENENSETWTCRMESSTQIFYATGKTRGVAEMKVTQDCKNEAFTCILKECTKE